MGKIMSKTVIQHVLSRLHDIGVKCIFGVAGDFAFRRGGPKRAPNG
jgi:TPP-dependent 2-oxoacid decarboxylase